MKILVTGCDGYIGCMLVQVLLKQGFDVLGLDTGFYRNAWLYNGIENFPQIITEDIRKIGESELKGVDVVVHLAELSNDPLGQTNEEVTYEINHQGTVHLAEVAKACGVKKFIYFSSCSVYGASDEISSEESPTNPLTAYARCKILNENVLRDLASDTFSPTILRNATAYGVSPRMRLDLVVNNLSALAYTIKVVRMESDGTPWRPFVHILDIAHTVVCVIKAPRDVVFNQIFNVGAKNANYQIKEIAKIINDIFPECQVTLNPAGADKRNYRVDFKKINTILPNFRCEWSVKDGVEQLKKIFEHVQMSKTMAESRNFTRLKQIEYLLNTHQIDDHLFWKEI